MPDRDAILSEEAFEDWIGYLCADAEASATELDRLMVHDAALRARVAVLTEERDALRTLVEAQAEDEGVWFVAETAAEAYLQQELRRLHAAIEEGAR